MCIAGPRLGCTVHIHPGVANTDLQDAFSWVCAAMGVASLSLQYPKGRRMLFKRMCVSQSLVVSAQDSTWEEGDQEGSAKRNSKDYSWLWPVTLASFPA